ncbi:hypothetical protein O181_026216 [Austropuccinia psidii MF-1]|uniref:Uncharacterized protein n=1 Tax=Austropuccinia psidii MF-1 TaxID=1389203 RepID=A0A9Q3CPZ2_9BASI|nr:hypothetical protein [Austropuccinia psidii MF-1]
MSSSKPRKSRSGAVHDSDSESSIKYIQTQSPLSPNIPLTAPIASSMNVSGPKIDVGNAMAQTSSTWSTPNISVTPIPPNPSNKQMHVSEGPGSTPEISSKAHPQLQFPHMAPKGKSVGSQEPIEDCDELYASSPLVHKEKVTGCHHPYASKPRTGHASSSREKIVDDEDENISPTQSERNDEPRRDDFMAHDQGTQSNSKFTHPQMGLAQSMLEQSEVRQQRSQACKSHNMAKRESQKEQQKWLRAELP